MISVLKRSSGLMGAPPNKDKTWLKLAFYMLIVLMLLTGAVMHCRIGTQHFPVRKIKYLCMIGYMIVAVILEKGLSTNGIMASMFTGFFLAMHIPFTPFRKDYVLDIMLPVIVTVYFCYVLIHKKQIGTLFRAFSDLIICIAVISLIFWLFGSILGVMPGRTMVRYYWAEHWNKSYTYFRIYFENPLQYTKMLGKTIPRNTGVFMEAPGYNVMIAYTLAIECAFNNYRNKWRIGILFITILTSLSTKGLIFILEIIFLRALFNDNSKSSIKKLAFALSLPLLIIAELVVGNKLLSDKSDTNSWAVRMDDLGASLRTWVEHPFFGAGYNNDAEIVRHFHYHLRTNDGLSMGLAVLLALGGIFLVAFYLCSYLLPVKAMRKKQNKQGVLLAACLIITNLAFSNSAFGMFGLFIVSLGYASFARYLARGALDNDYDNADIMQLIFRTLTEKAEQA